MSNVPIGSPDWQRGVVAAGKLLASVPSGTSSAIVTLPPNARSLVVASPSSKVTDSLQVVGVTSGLSYSGTYLITATYALFNTGMFAFSVSPETDQQVTVTFAAAPTHEWFIYCHSGPQVVSVPELSLAFAYSSGPANQGGMAAFGTDGVYSWQIRTNADGQIIPMVPTHGNKFTPAIGTVQLLPALANNAYYLFGVDVSEAGTSTAPVELVDANGNSICYDDPSGGGESHSISLNGFYTSAAISAITTVSATIVLRYSIGPL